ncbi:hypothetical protein BDZ97DRAFT_1912890 [Flammula alnicola]|nr:hypothetical protein BDZ97DRAFT_1912890 [Flammula alnicola]
MASDMGEQDIVMNLDHPIHPPPALVPPMAWPSENLPVVMMEKGVGRKGATDRSATQVHPCKDIESTQSHGASNAAVIPPASGHVPDRQTSMLEDKDRGSNSSVITHQTQTTAVPATLSADSIMREGEFKPEDEDMTDDEAEIQAILACVPSQDLIYLTTARFPRSIICASPILALSNHMETSTIGPPGDFQMGSTFHSPTDSTWNGRESMWNGENPRGMVMESTWNGGNPRGMEGIHVEWRESTWNGGNPHGIRGNFNGFW